MIDKGHEETKEGLIKIFSGRGKTNKSYGSNLWDTVKYKPTMREILESKIRICVKLVEILGLTIKEKHLSNLNEIEGSLMELIDITKGDI